MNQPEPQSMPFPILMSEIEKGIIKIPQFQRDFVWTKEKSAKLLDSILKGYPIGTFILWKTKESLRFVRNLGQADLPETSRRRLRPVRSRWAAKTYKPFRER